MVLECPHRAVHGDRGVIHRGDVQREGGFGAGVLAIVVGAAVILQAVTEAGGPVEVAGGLEAQLAERTHRNGEAAFGQVVRGQRGVAEVQRALVLAGQRSDDDRREAVAFLVGEREVLAAEVVGAAFDHHRFGVLRHRRIVHGGDVQREGGVGAGVPAVVERATVVLDPVAEADFAVEVPGRAEGQQAQVRRVDGKADRGEHVHGQRLAVEVQRAVALFGERGDDHRRQRIAVDVAEGEVLGGEGVLAILRHVDGVAHGHRRIADRHHDAVHERLFAEVQAVAARVADAEAEAHRAVVVGRGLEGELVQILDGNDQTVLAEVFAPHRMAVVNQAAVFRQRGDDHGRERVAVNVLEAEAVGGEGEDAVLVHREGVAGRRRIADRLHLQREGRLLAGVLATIDEGAAVAQAVGKAVVTVEVGTGDIRQAPQVGDRHDKTLVPEVVGIERHAIEAQLAMRRQAGDQHRGEAVAVDVGEAEVLGREGALHVLVGRGRVLTRHRRIAHRRHGDAHRGDIAQVGASAAGVDDAVFKGGGVVVLLRGAVGEQAEFFGTDGETTLTQVLAAQAHAVEIEIAGLRQRRDDHAGQRITIHVGEAELGGREVVFTLLEHRGGTGGGHRRIADRRHVDGEGVHGRVEVDATALGAAVVLHLELEAGITLAIGIGVCDEAQAALGDVGGADEQAIGQVTGLDRILTQQQRATGGQRHDADGGEVVGTAGEGGIGLVGEREVGEREHIRLVFNRRHGRVGGARRIIHGIDADAHLGRRIGHVEADVMHADLGAEHAVEVFGSLEIHLVQVGIGDLVAALAVGHQRFHRQLAVGAALLELHHHAFDIKAHADLVDGVRLAIVELQFRVQRQHITAALVALGKADAEAGARADHLTQSAAIDGVDDVGQVAVSAQREVAVVLFAAARGGTDAGEQVLEAGERITRGLQRFLAEARSVAQRAVDRCDGAGQRGQVLGIGGAHAGAGQRVLEHGLQIVGVGQVQRIRLPRRACDRADRGIGGGDVASRTGAGEQRLDRRDGVEHHLGPVFGSAAIGGHAGNRIVGAQVGAGRQRQAEGGQQARLSGGGIQRSVLPHHLVEQRGQRRHDRGAGRRAQQHALEGNVGQRIHTAVHDDGGTGLVGGQREAAFGIGVHRLAIGLAVAIDVQVDRGALHITLHHLAGDGVQLLRIVLVIIDQRQARADGADTQRQPQQAVVVVVILCGGRAGGSGGSAGGFGRRARGFCKRTDLALAFPGGGGTGLHLGSGGIGGGVQVVDGGAAGFGQFDHAHARQARAVDHAQRHAHLAGGQVGLGQQVFEQHGLAGHQREAVAGLQRGGRRGGGIGFGAGAIALHLGITLARQRAAEHGQRQRQRQRGTVTAGKLAHQPLQSSHAGSLVAGSGALIDSGIHVEPRCLKSVSSGWWSGRRLAGLREAIPPESP